MSTNTHNENRDISPEKTALTKIQETLEEIKNQNQNNPKETAFYSAVVNAWTNNSYELDKHLLTLSGGAIGLLTTLLSTKGVTSIESLLLYAVSMGSFFVCILSILWIFKRNSKYLREVAHGRDTTDELLDSLDTIAIGTFLLGLIFAAIIGIATAIHLFNGV